MAHNNLPHGENNSLDEANAKLARKMQERRFRWEWNTKLLGVSIALAIGIILISVASYLFHSSKTNRTFMSLADVAGEKKDFATQAKWLRRYSLLNPGDSEIIIKMAVAADTAADEADGNQFSSIYKARKQLGESIALLGNLPEGDQQSSINDLRRRLINRLLQMELYSEAERQVIALRAEEADRESLNWLSQALYGLIRDGKYRQRPTDVPKSDYWYWLSCRPAGEVFLQASEDTSDLDSVARCLFAYQDHSEVFGVDLTASDQTRLHEQIESRVASLRANDAGRAQLILYQFEKRRMGEDDSLELLVSAASAASTRLAAEQSSSSVEPSNLSAKLTDRYWDYLVVLEGVQAMSTINPEMSKRWCDQLLPLGFPELPAKTRATTFVTAGLLEEFGQNRERAIEIWDQGLEEVSENNLDLLGVLANARARDRDDAKAAEIVKRFEAAVSASIRMANRLTDTQVSQAQRAELENRNALATWRLDLVQSYLAIGGGDKMAGIAGLEKCLNSTTDVTPPERLIVARRLAALHGSEGSWDRAAAAVDRAIFYFPNDKLLRAESAEAHTRAGNRRQAAEQWKVAGTSNLIALQIRALEALFNYELRLAPDQREFSAIRVAIDRLRSEISSRPVPQTNEDQRLRDQWIARVEVLTASLPERGNNQVEQHLVSEEMGRRVAVLASKYGDNELIQAFAAERLAAVGRPEDARKALNRMRDIAGTDSSAVVMTDARIRAELGDLESAADLLIAQSEKDPDLAANLLERAGNYASQAGSPELAYQAYSKIDAQTLATLYLTATSALSLPDDSRFLAEDGKKLSQIELADRWRTRLADREGDSPTYSLFLDASEIIEELASDPNIIERNDPRLIELSDLSRTILKSRPTWGPGISVRGWMHSLTGNHNEAVEQFRRAMAAGDRRLQTRYRLWEDLKKAGRFDEADAEIRKASYSTETSLDQYAGLRIQLAQQKGDFKSSIKVATAAVEADPDDFLKHVLLCNSATIAARADSANREEYLTVAVGALGRARELTNADQASVFDAALKLWDLQNNQDGIREELKAIAASNLLANEKLLMRAAGHSLLNEQDERLELLLAADRLNSDFQIKIRLAETYGKLDRVNDRVRAFEEALLIQRDNERVRNDLALAIVERDGDKVDWNRLKSLLGGKGNKSASNRLLYGTLLTRQKNLDQQDTGVNILRQILKERNSRSDDAARLLCLILRERIKSVPEDKQSQIDRIDSEIRTMYEGLVQRRDPRVVDLYQYSNYLISMYQDADKPKVEELVERLAATQGKEGRLAALEVGMRLAQETGNRDRAPEIVNLWADDVIEHGVFDDIVASSVAGSSLLKMGFEEDGVEWFRRAYQKSSNALGQYVAALNRVKDFDKAIEVVTRHHSEHDDAKSATLLVETLINRPSRVEEFQSIIKKAYLKNPKDPALLEAIATLRMMQHRYDDAIAIYESILKVAPNRIRTLNNLAMAFSEIPGRELNGLKPIDLAIELAGEAPELLDTKGVVLLRAGRLQEAESTFQQAILLSSNPRYQFHLILAMVAQDKTAESKREWKTLDLEELNPSGLTMSEQDQLARMKISFSN